jgi:hypothetical protein
MNKLFLLICFLAIFWLSAWTTATASPSDGQSTGSSATRTTETTGRASEKNGSPKVQTYSTGYARNRSDQQHHSSYRVRDPVLRLDETRTFYRDYKQYLRAKEKALKNSEVPAQHQTTTAKSAKPGSMSVQDSAATLRQRKCSGKCGIGSSASRAKKTGGHGTRSNAKVLTYKTGYVRGGQVRGLGYGIGDFDYTLRRGRTWKPD